MDQKYTLKLDEVERGTLIDMLQTEIRTKSNYSLSCASILERLRATVPDVTDLFPTP